MGEMETPEVATPSLMGRSTDGTESAGPSTIPDDVAEDVVKYRRSKEGKELVGWVLAEFEKARGARSQFEDIWRRNLAMYRNREYGEFPQGTLRKPGVSPDQAKRRQRRSINRLRSFVRTEHSKFVSQEPAVTVVPSSSEDMDFRAATAGEQVWRSISSASFLDVHYSQAAWWKVLTGNGFLKTYWDGTSIDPVSGEAGMIRFGAVTPFHLFVPDLRETSIEEQPFIFNGYTKTLAWARARYGKILDGVPAGDFKLDASKGPNPELKDYPESVTVMEVWVKPGAHKLLPDGGLLHLVGCTLVGITKTMPYMHGLYPYAHLSHLYTGGFYTDSSLDDLIDLQKEYNEVRTDISRASRQMGRPQLIVPKGSYTVAKHTNETGLVIEYTPGMTPPAPLPLAELPQYVLQQQDRILADFEDISGQHEVSRGQAPGRGVTAGTAIAYLQESDDQYLTPQYRNDERAFEKVARQSLELFVQYVPNPRKIKSVGDDRAFDMLMLSGADIRNGTDVRVEKGSSISTSQVARRAEIKEMFDMGLLTPEQAVAMLELGGSERIKETIDVARSKAQRENIRMKNLTEAEILPAEDDAVAQARQTLEPEAMADMVGPQVQEHFDSTGEFPDQEQMDGLFEQSLREAAPPLVQADDFDIHDLHIEVHNQFRMTQEYENLSDAAKDQFRRHVEQHEQYLMEAQQMQLDQALMGAAPPEEEPAEAPAEEDGPPVKEAPVGGPGTTTGTGASFGDGQPRGPRAPSL